MKKIALCLVMATALSACSSTNNDNNNQSASPSVTDIPREIKMFIDVCIMTSPTFNDARQKAVENGMSDFTDAGPVGTLGFNDDKSIGVQIKKNKECVITTDSKADKALTEKFIRALTQKKGLSKVPFGMIVKGEKFIFMHDRKDGEAYVMLKAKNK